MREERVGLIERGESELPLSQQADLLVVEVQALLDVRGAGDEALALDVGQHRQAARDRQDLMAHPGRTEDGGRRTRLRQGFRRR